MLYILFYIKYYFMRILIYSDITIHEGCSMENNRVMLTSVSSFCHSRLMKICYGLIGE